MHDKINENDTSELQTQQVNKQITLTVSMQQKAKDKTYTESLRNGPGGPWTSVCALNAAAIDTG